MTGNHQRAEDKRERSRSDADLGQKEARREKASEEQLRHMETGAETKESQDKRRAEHRK